jgi:hypothetical protein
MSGSYQSGVCNIGPSEIAQRKKVAMAGFISAAIFGVLVSLSGSHSPVRFAIFLPLLIGSIGLIQARKKFCLAFGLLGVYNFGIVGRHERVVDEFARAADRKVANKIILQSLALAVVLTAAFVAL